MSDLLNQAKNAAATAVNAAANAASSAATTTSNLASQAYNSETTANLANTATNLAGQASTLAGQAANTAHAQAHAIAPTLIPAPAAGAGSGIATPGGVDKSHDLEPASENDKAKLEKLFAGRATAEELQDKGILKGQPGDALAGKRAELEKSMLGDRLDKELANRPTADDLVKKGILSPDEKPSA